MNPDVHTLTGAYVLDALDEVQRRQFERHLAECPDCAGEVDELRATATRLGTAVAERPPDGLRERVLGQVAVTRQEPAGRQAAPTRPRRWALRLTAAAAVIALAGVVGLGAVAVHLNHELDTAQAQIDQAQQRYGPVAEVFAAPDAQTVTTSGGPDGSAIMLVSHQQGKAVLMVSGMPNPPTAHTYQAWVIGTDGTHSAGVFRPGSNATVAPFAFPLGNATQVGVTVEPDGGSAQPTTDPLLLIDVPV